MAKGWNIRFLITCSTALFVGVAAGVVLYQTHSRTTTKDLKVKVDGVDGILLAYDHLVTEMSEDFSRDASVRLSSSTRHVYKHQNYAKIVALGSPVVPAVMLDLEQNRSGFAPEILEGILPDVAQKLGDLYGDKYWYNYSDKQRQTWLRWWSEYGRKRQWDRKGE